MTLLLTLVIMLALLMTMFTPSIAANPASTPTPSMEDRHAPGDANTPPGESLMGDLESTTKYSGATLPTEGSSAEGMFEVPEEGTKNFSPDSSETTLIEMTAEQGDIALINPESQNAIGEDIIQKAPAQPQPKGENAFTGFFPPPPGSKDYPEEPGAIPVGTASPDLPAGAVEALSATGSLITCSAPVNYYWTTASSDFSIVQQCSLSIPQDGYAYISANASMAYYGINPGDVTEALFEIGIDNTLGDSNIDRWINMYWEFPLGRERPVALSVLKPITAGKHTFYFLGKHYSGPGSIGLFDSALTVIFIPSASASVLACGESGNTNYTNTTNSFTVARQCSLTVPEAGWVFLSADGSMAYNNGEYESEMQLSVDNTGGDGVSSRFTNVYTDTVDGTDKSVAVTEVKNIAAGTHTFYFLGRRYSGAGTVLMYDPTLTAIFVPDTSQTAKSCGDSGSTYWDSSSQNYSVLRQCTLSIPQDGYAFISVNGSLGNVNGDYIAHFRLGIDSTASDNTYNRWVWIGNDSGDGDDESVDLSVLQPITAGTHTFYFLGRLWASASAGIRVYAPTISVIFIPKPSPAALTCGASGHMELTNSSSSAAVLRQCALTVPQDGWVYIAANTSMEYVNYYYEARLNIAIDNSAASDAATDRYVNVYASNGTDETGAISILKPIAAGRHTFYFRMIRVYGSGMMKAIDPTLSVVYIPYSSTTAQACSVYGDGYWQTNSFDFVDILQCSLSAPQNGYVFISSSGSPFNYNGEYEAAFRIGIDNTSGDEDIDRWVNIYNDGYDDGTDKSMAISVLKPISAGAHTFYLLMRRYNGSGYASMYDPTLSVIYVPSAASALTKSCGDSGNLTWSTASSSYSTIKTCSLTFDRDGFVLVSADGSMANSNGGYKARFQISMDGAYHDADAKRWVEVNADTGDGSDKSVALSQIMPVTKGTHTLSFVGLKSSGSGDVQVHDPTLTVFAPGNWISQIFLPLLLR